MNLPWKPSRRGLLAVAAVTGAMLAVGAGSSAATLTWEKQRAPFDSTIEQNAKSMVAQGRQTFRFDTFGDQAFWGDTIQLHKAIEGQKLGGVGPGVSPKTALAVGLKVDSDALPDQLKEQLKAGQVNLDDPATTLALLKLNAVVGLTGFFNPDGSLKSMGIQCALCHSTVDNSFAPGIGHRLDGWANRDLNVGAIVSLAPNLQPVADVLGVDVPTLKAVLASWGPGKFDAEVFMDGKALNVDATGVNRAPVLIPPAYGLAGDNLHTWTGWGSVTYWNAFVANLEMHGIGTFFDERLDNAQQFPIAAKDRSGHVTAPQGQDQITAKLAALQFYQLSIPAPTPPAGSFDPAAAARGQALFNGKAQCATCHVPPLFTEPGNNIHTPQEIGIDPFQANRAPAYVIGDASGNPVVVHGYRTAPLKGLWAHQKGGFFHDGRFATLGDVVNHYDTQFNLGLTDQEKHDIVQYLLSI
jgi:cytochrome c peroxidase